MTRRAEQNIGCDDVGFEDDGAPGNAWRSLSAHRSGRQSKGRNASARAELIQHAIDDSINRLSVKIHDD
ncbi:MAG: hypothetical protein KF861_00790 [Planctomycetaceae bacterium]|nr:hypothetical protein [Planctomycetaceae bacterium]